MARKPVTDLSAWPSLALEGNLIVPAMVAQVAEPKDDADSRASYGIRKGLNIREEIATAFRVGQAHFDIFAQVKQPSAERTRRFVQDFVQETFGFDDLAPGDDPVALVAGERVPIVVVPPAEERLDRRSPTLSTERARSPASALQDRLNDREDMLWGLVINGTLIRLMRDNASLTRPAYIEADLAAIFTNEDAASFSVLWLLIHRSRFGASGAPVTDCALERWRDTGAREGEAARDRLAAQVRLALKVLGSGFLEANPELAAQLQSGAIPLTDWFNELLRLVYRLIFLMVAEDRQLLHPDTASLDARTLYAAGYSLTHLRAQSARASSWDKHFDRFDGIKIVFRALADGEPRLGLPALGGLFATDQLPHLDRAWLRNRACMEALYRLAWLAERSALVPVNWRAMETEELGSVYESLLELQPQLGDDGKSLVFAAEAAEQRGNQRKTTGSYYTPDSLVQTLLDTALDPVLDGTEAEASDPAAALLALAVIDPACGSGHFLLAAARRIATRVARLRSDGTPALADYRHALREVARCCLHGVDRNPMAVELTRVALWIETVDPGLPLGFFDAQIRCGDALLGVFDLKVLENGIPDAAYKPLTGDDKQIAKYYLKANKDAKLGVGGFDFDTGPRNTAQMKPLALDFSGLRALPEDTLEQIAIKAERFAALRAGSSFHCAGAAADLYIAAFLLPKTGPAPTSPSMHRVPTTTELWRALNQGEIAPALQDAPKVARSARAFHWPLEFPDVMARGGFDVVLGNPPWEVMQLSDKEFFANKKPEIVALPGAARKKAIEDLKETDPVAYKEFAIEKRCFDAGNEFARESGRFQLTARGKINSYSLFVELFLKLHKNAAGLIVPTGIATNESTSELFGHLIKEKRLIALFSFTEIKAWFAGTKDNQSFCLLTIGESAKPMFCFQIENPTQVKDHSRIFTLTPEDVMAINPNTKTAPVFRSRADAEIVSKIYRKVPILLDELSVTEKDSWKADFRQGLFNMTSKSELFLSASELYKNGSKKSGVNFINQFEAQEYVPLYEAKMVNFFDHRWGYYTDGSVDDTRALSRPSNEEKSCPDYDIAPRFWIARSEVEGRLAEHNWEKGWILVHRALTNKTNERTFISSIVPRQAVGNSLIVWAFAADIDCNKIACLYGNTSSLVLDFVVRNKIGGTNLNAFYLRQFPILASIFYIHQRIAFIVPKVLELTYTSHSLAPFARDLGHDGPPFRWDEARRAQLRADLDAFYARAYGLTRDELRYILDPADVKGPDYPSETFRVLKDKETRHFGEYRTRRLVLAAWDRMETEGEFSALGL